MREHKKDFVLLFLSALSDPETKLAGLELGADDYITKPFDLRELTLRLERILSTTTSLERAQDEVILGFCKSTLNAMKFKMPMAESSIFPKKSVPF